jgi:hypothetical protein
VVRATVLPVFGRSADYFDVYDLLEDLISRLTTSMLCDPEGSCGDRRDDEAGEDSGTGSLLRWRGDLDVETPTSGSPYA